MRDFDLINDTDSLYSFVVPVQYPKAGTTNSAARAGVVSADGGEPVWLDVPGDPRNNYIARLEWAASSDELVLEHLNRAQNTIDVMLGDARTGRTRTVLTERDSAWVDVVDDLRWIDGGKRFTWISERDGWRHLYVGLAGWRQDPAGDARRVRPSQPRKRLRRGLHRRRGFGGRVGLLHGVARRRHAALPVPHPPRREGQAGARHAAGPARLPHLQDLERRPVGVPLVLRLGTPTVVDLVRLPKHEKVRTLVANQRLRDAVARLRQGAAEFVKVDAGDGLRLDGWVMKPPGFDSTKRYPLLYLVYGEPAGQTALDQWDGSYPWYVMLTQQGYVVASVDNRGTPSPRGRAFRKAIYKKIGLVNSADQAGAARTMRRWAWVDSTRVGVWGWSGGGSTTLNLMFRYPELYQTGMAVAPVPDERLYDTIYQERYMGLPQENEAVYHDGSPLFFADRLRGNLLVVHGSGDDNVHFQGTERLINALVAANRPFTLMVYPNRTHCICEGDGTGLHLYSLLTRYLEQNLPAGAR